MCIDYAFYKHRCHAVRLMKLTAILETGRVVRTARLAGGRQGGGGGRGAAPQRGKPCLLAAGVSHVKMDRSGARLQRGVDEWDPAGGRGARGESSQRNIRETLASSGAAGRD